MIERRPALGKGLSALIPDAPEAPRQGVLEVDIDLLAPSDQQPRLILDEAKLEELAQSIRVNGIIQPILVRRTGTAYRIIAGERRWRAAQRAQLHHIPAIVRDLDDAATAEVALIENVQRADLSAIEEADGYRQLIATYAHSQEDVARLVGKSRSHVANLLRLLDLPEEVREMLLRGDISMGHARAIATAPDPAALARRIVAEGLSVRQAEALGRGDKPSRPKPANGNGPGRPVDADLAALERQLGDLTGLKVRVAHGQGGGTVALHYSTLDQLDMICQRLSGEPI